MVGERLTTECILPSKGLTYGGRIPEGKVRVASMTTKEEKLFLGTRPASDFDEVLDVIFSRCADLSGVPPYQLLSSDRFYLLLMIRAASYGKSYSYSWSCPDCNKSNTKKVDLPDSFNIIYLPDNFVEPFEVKLPRSGDVLRVRLLRGSDEREAKKYAEKILRNSDGNLVGDPGYTYRIAKRIVEVVGKHKADDDFGAILSYVDNMVSEDSLALSNACIDNDCGVDTITEHTCSYCGSTNSLPMVPEVQFFRPIKRAIVSS